MDNDKEKPPPFCIDRNMSTYHGSYIVGLCKGVGHLVIPNQIIVKTWDLKCNLAYLYHLIPCQLFLLPVARVARVVARYVFAAFVPDGLPQSDLHSNLHLLMFFQCDAVEGENRGSSAASLLYSY